MEVSGLRTKYTEEKTWLWRHRMPDTMIVFSKE